MARVLMLVGILAGLIAHAQGAPSFKEQHAALEKELAAQPTNTALLFRIADLCHDEGVKDNKAAVKLAEQHLRALLKLDPSNAPAIALLGSTYTMKGRDAFWPTTQISLVKEGCKFMDQAAALAPENFQVRLMRGLNNVHMPAFLKREEVARTDLDWLWKKIQAAPADHSVTVKQEVALWHGVALKKTKQTAEAKTVWQAGIDLDPKSRFAAEIHKRLDKEN